MLDKVTVLVQGCLPASVLDLGDTLYWIGRHRETLREMDRGHIALGLLHALIMTLTPACTPALDAMPAAKLTLLAYATHLYCYLFVLQMSTMSWSATILLDVYAGSAIDRERE